MRCFRQGLLAGVFLGSGLAALPLSASAQGDPAAVEAPAAPVSPALPAAPEAPPAPVIASTGDPVLDKAIADARASLPHFWEHASKFPGQAHWHIVKIGLPSTEGGNENVWIYTTEKQGDDLKGVIVTQPESLVGGLRKGGKIEFKESDVIDWSYDEDGLRRGEFTKRAEFADLTPAEIAEALDYEAIHPTPVP